MVTNIRRNSGTAYKGVEPSQPPQLLYVNRRPTVNDYKNFNPGTFWVYDNGSDREVYSLLSIENNQAVWVILNVTLPGGGTFDFVTDGGTATQSMGAIRIVGDGQIYTTGSDNTITVNLRDNIAEDFVTDNGTASSVAQTINVITDIATNKAGATVQFSAPGPSNTVLLEVSNSADGNTMLGKGAGNTTATGAGLSFLGVNVAPSVTTSSFSTIVGTSSGDQLTTGNNQTFAGAGVFPFVTTGESNIGLGFAAGFDCNVGTESSNVLINSLGVAGDANTIRVGIQGSSPGQQNATYMAGIYGSGVGGTNEWVKIDNAGKLGTTTTAPVSSGIVLLATYDLLEKNEQIIPLPVGYTRFTIKINELEIWYLGAGNAYYPLLGFSNDNGATYVNNTNGNIPMQYAYYFGSDEYDPFRQPFPLRPVSGLGVMRLLGQGQPANLTIELMNLNTTNTYPAYISRSSDRPVARNMFTWATVVMPTPDPVTIIKIAANPDFIGNRDSKLRGTLRLYGYVEQ